MLAGFFNPYHKIELATYILYIMIYNLNKEGRHG